jgi:type IV secretion system protein VirB10
MPPVVIEKTVTVIKEVPAPAPPPPIQPPPQPEAPPPPPPDIPHLAEITAAMQAGQDYRRQHGGLVALAGVGGVQQASLPLAAAHQAGELSPLSLHTGLPPITAPEHYQAEGRDSTSPIDNERLIAADRIIPVVLETGINSQIDGTTGGPVILQVSRDVYGYHGRYILVPKGSRMICQYQSPTDIGSSRLEIRCGRILLGGSRAEIFELVAQGTDQQARLGITGAVDGRFVERYGTAFALAGISAFVRYAASSTTTSESSANQNSAVTTGAEELSKSLGEISAAALEKTLDLKPIITVPQGTRMTIRPTFDWYIKPAA